jgi:hypothetical protein
MLRLNALRVGRRNAGELGCSHMTVRPYLGGLSRRSVPLDISRAARRRPLVT